MKVDLCSTLLVPHHAFRSPQGIFPGLPREVPPESPESFQTPLTGRVPLPQPFRAGRASVPPSFTPGGGSAGVMEMTEVPTIVNAHCEYVGGSCVSI